MIPKIFKKKQKVSFRVSFKPPMGSKACLPCGACGCGCPGGLAEIHHEASTVWRTRSRQISTPHGNLRVSRPMKKLTQKK